jgi:uncharacterized membrane protein (DUF2068 family)
VLKWELRACARHGHVLYAPDEPEARARLHASGPDGDLWQCLRCASFTAPSERSPLDAGPVIDVPLVARGKELRSLLLMRVLGVERYIRGTLVVLLALGVWQFHAQQGHLRAAFDNLVPHLRPIGSWMGVDLAHAGIVQSARQVLDVQPKLVLIAAGALLAYGLLQLLEGTGLWLGRRWGEYVAVVATSVFLPLEIHEVLKGASVLKIGALAVNIVAVIWLVYNGRLFGVRGGHDAYVAARRGEAVLDPADFLPGVEDIGAAPGETGHARMRPPAPTP